MRMKRSKRRGLALIPSMVCLLLVSLLSAALLKNAHMQRMLARGEQRRMQAEWLAEAGLARAAAKLAGDRKYQGETWELTGAEMGGEESAVVRISLKRIEKDARRGLLSVQADFPKDDVGRARISKELTVKLMPDTDNQKPGGL